MFTDHTTQDSIELCLRAQRAIDDIADIRDELKVTRAECRHLVAQARQRRLDSALPQEIPSANDVQMPPLINPLQTAIEPLQQEKLALHMMRAILNDFPLEIQATLLKVLSVRTMVLIHDELRRPMTLSA